jgi:hypothetical protein
MSVRIDSLIIWEKASWLAPLARAGHIDYTRLHRPKIAASVLQSVICNAAGKTEDKKGPPIF